MLDRDARDPLSAILHAGGAPVRETYRDPPWTDLATLRIAATPDFGFAPTERAIAETFRKKLATFGSAFRSLEWSHPDCSHADGCSGSCAVAFGACRELAEKYPDR
jgi:hypothetical protein